MNQLAMRSALAIFLTIFIPVAGFAARSCTTATFAGIAPENVSINEVSAELATTELPVAHCVVRGAVDARVGADGKPYAVSFELRLPSDWTRRLAHQFNGGNDGAVVPALGNQGIFPENLGALRRGFAVVSSDAGHDGSANPEAGLAGPNQFGLEFEARRDYGYGAVAKLHPVAVALTQNYYGATIEYTYGIGSSNGGRHALIAASRMPDSFDGLLAGYPGTHLPRAAVQHAWDVQHFRSVGPSLAEAYSRDELAIVSEHVRRACDALDGLEDGLIFDVEACQRTFDPNAMTCDADGGDHCLPREKVRALIEIFGGPRNSAGEQIYNEWFWDTGVSAENWRNWKLESRVPPWNYKPTIAVMGSGSLAQVFTTPPTPLDGDPASLEAYLMAFDFDRDAPKIDATSTEFPESAMQIMTPPDSDSPTLEGFESNGGKLIIYHGVSDPVFSFKDTVDWYESLHDNNADAEEFVRLYAIPGMPHGPGGVAADSVDLLGSLIDWVEKGIAPGAVIATVREDRDEIPQTLRGASRKLCPWPAVATFVGGDSRSAEAFRCSD